MGCESGEDIIRRMMLEMFRFRATGPEIMIFDDCLETPTEVAQALCDILGSSRLDRSESNCIVVAMSGGLFSPGRGMEFTATSEDWEKFWSNLLQDASSGTIAERWEVSFVIPDFQHLAHATRTFLQNPHQRFHFVVPF